MQTIHKEAACNRFVHASFGVDCVQIILDVTVTLTKPLSILTISPIFLKNIHKMQSMRRTLLSRAATALSHEFLCGSDIAPSRNVEFLFNRSIYGSASSLSQPLVGACIRWPQILHLISIMGRLHHHQLVQMKLLEINQRDQHQKDQGISSMQIPSQRRRQHLAAKERTKRSKAKLNRYSAVLPQTSVPPCRL